MTELVTNANDVAVYLKKRSSGSEASAVRVKANEFTLATEQNITGVGDIGSSDPSELRGLSKGNLSHSFEFTVQGDQVDIQKRTTEANGDAIPLEMRAEKPKESDPETTVWKYSFDLVLCESEEISGTSGDPLGYSVEGVAAGRGRSGLSDDN